jgi:hypothetical protein
MPHANLVSQRPIEGSLPARTYVSGSLARVRGWTLDSEIGTRNSFMRVKQYAVGHPIASSENPPDDLVATWALVVFDRRCLASVCPPLIRLGVQLHSSVLKLRIVGGRRLEVK